MLKKRYNRILLAVMLIPSAVACAQQKPRPIFDGHSLKGWDGDTSIWRAGNGVLTGEIRPDRPLKTNSFIIWQGGQPGDFELTLEFRITEKGNSGINYRSEAVTGVDHALKGYQADIDGGNRYTGQNYEERGRTTLAYRGQVVTIPASGLSLDQGRKNNAWTPMQVKDSLDLKNSVKPAGEWNTVRLVAKGNRLQHYINGKLISDVTDNDPDNRKTKGLLGMQVHVGPPMKVEYRKIILKEG
ncbi:3-keto-disaccharide hydrolase [Chitinophaga lutea]